MNEYDCEKQDKRRNSFNPIRTMKSCCGIVGLFLVIIFLSARVVPPAHIGVVVTLGQIGKIPLESGLHITNPLASVILFTTKTQLMDSENNVPTIEGLNVELDVALLFHLDVTQVEQLYLKLGVQYEDVYIKSELASAVRGLTSEKSAKALYTAGRRELQTKLFDELHDKFSPRGIILEDVLLKAIKLPTQLTSAIEVKAQAEQESARMEFVLTKEKQEAERKQIEAEGIAGFQKIVSEGISEQLLAWKGIEATEKLAESSNSKVVIMGNGKNDLPVILSATSE